MERRSILKYVAAMTGAAICSPLSAANLLNTPTTITGVPTSRQHFSSDTLSHIASIMDTILPKTDTPSATDVGVHMVMDGMFHNVFDDNYQQRFANNYAAFRAYLDAQGFSSLSGDEKKQLLITLEQQKTPSDVYKAYIDVKQQTLSYYLANEVIAENHLNYLPIPGRYVPRISVSDVGGKAWAE
ncbi:gluconate 2-dehydrogenase subunit 3 family protein [Alteromonas sp. KUL49]|uniref:gluconate 2-dehydrogenase subunit 3 family protein n=1 Tax=Alteromonas sp. KUL49 TaxID=2480798 RepID=UPI00102EFF91|nr:gluconate 2-dehydrogenase subunit 3 family protein [Alteromonas sp. KUL49]TAP42274.1 gluconate 2-dehydrogenase subunit 3 family protein [Alteromonas sp. KUL49]GEA09873.1 twin-arginine translocation pathway signal protein [Alteromonas sp. KUL49]